MPWFLVKPSYTLGHSRSEGMMSISDVKEWCEVLLHFRLFQNDLGNKEYDYLGWSKSWNPIPGLSFTNSLHWVITLPSCAKLSQSVLKQSRLGWIRLHIVRAYLSRLPWIFPRAPLNVNGALRNTSEWHHNERWPVNSQHKWPVTRKMFPCDDVIMMRARRTCIPQWRGLIISSGQFQPDFHRNKSHIKWSNEVYFGISKYDLCHTFPTDSTCVI